jgi:hypothetical protein
MANRQRPTHPLVSYETCPAIIERGGVGGGGGGGAVGGRGVHRTKPACHKTAIWIM